VRAVDVAEKEDWPRTYDPLIPLVTTVAEYTMTRFAVVSATNRRSFTALYATPDGAARTVWDAAPAFVVKSDCPRTLAATLPLVRSDTSKAKPR
jgi:hypothetical protein